ncbi:hypothetical protein SpCBS45565_g03028 [Spizellomyces sp. 'palustris']|nr:hypothetical protein SpCBS45565_g03028 [Spizellomyces sp. 'palustris']
MSTRLRNSDTKKRKTTDTQLPISHFQQSTLDHFANRAVADGSSSLTGAKKPRLEMQAKVNSGPARNGVYLDLTNSSPSSMDDSQYGCGFRGDAKGKGKAPVGVPDSPIAVTAPLARGRREPGQKLVIKSFKVKPKLPENFVTDTWKKLEQAVHAVHESKPVADSLEELYKACENLCHHKKADELYAKLRDVCDQHIQKELGKIKSTHDITILKIVHECWSNHCRQMILIRSIFLYLDRTYVLQTSGLRSLWDMGLDLFRERIMDDMQPVKLKTVKALLYEIERERNGEQVERELLRSLLRMFLELSIYFSGFDAAFRERTELYYREESDRRIDALDNEGSGGGTVARYLEHVEIRLQQEVERCSAGMGYLDVGSKKGLVTVVETQLLKRHIKTLLDKGLHELMEDTRTTDLARMYALFNRVGATADLRKAFSQYIRKTGLTLVSSEARDPTMVDDLLKFKTRVDHLWEKSFAKNEGFGNALREAFEFFINQRQNKPAELIAKYVDVRLRSGKGVTEEELEVALDQCLVLFRFIHGKDVFEAFYKKDLAKRLLLQRSTSVDAEKSMLSKLKTECGPNFTSKLEGMFKDVEISRDYMTSFRESPRYTNQLGAIELSVNVLTQGYWPTYPPININLPDELSHCQDVFKDFYMHKHSGRKLTWQNSLGTCILKSNFNKGKKELSVSLFQAIVLLLFNDETHHTYTEIREATGLENKELERTLQSLACGKVRVLNKTPKSKDISHSDSFEFNATFENALYRIKINQIQMKETSEEQKDTEERVFQDRQYQVDAAIVRIMKMRKTLSHSLLMTELFDQLKFPIKAADLKKRIESLIDRDYLERDAKDPTVYNYLA